MAMTNFIVSVAIVGGIYLMMRGDVKQTSSIFRRNVKHLRQWVEEESAAASKAAENAKPKELESKVPKKDVPKDN